MSPGFGKHDGLRSLCQRKLRSTGSKAERGKGKERRREMVQAGDGATLRRGRRVSEEDRATRPCRPWASDGEHESVQCQLPLLDSKSVNTGAEKEFLSALGFNEEDAKTDQYISTAAGRGGIGAYICHL